MAKIQKITPFLWFDSQAEEAARFYTGIFPHSKLGNITRYPQAGQEIHGRAAGSVMTVEFELGGQSFTALNGGPAFRFNEALSLMIGCESQQEVDHYWEKLGAGGDPAARQCGWLKDKYGLSWQVTPLELMPMIADPDRKKAERAFSAMMKMKKLDVAALRRAYSG
jgi:predicted 3-demethylubiquinone-9 3-methyltransferase (glyoxalase superfamily)